MEIKLQICLLCVPCAFISSYATETIPNKDFKERRGKELSDDDILHHKQK